MNSQASTHARRLAILAEPSRSVQVPVAVEEAGRGTEPIERAPRERDATPDPDYLLVGELAKATGKTVRAIHLYEDLGLLRPHERSKGRYRLFSADSVVRVRWIAKLQSLGLSLSEIQRLVRSQADQDSALFAAVRLREVFAVKLRETQDKLRELALLEAELEESLEYLDGCDTSCMPELPAQSCQQCPCHRQPGDPPELVAGVHAR